MKRLIIVLVWGVILSLSFSLNEQENSRKKVLISTSFGDIKIELYNETPLHRDNFIKLVNEGFYNDLL
ncbi:MAG: peptidylprolyl isomerase, partial [Mariniphaga sp.]|nr:peptidylprolyl isomerase [Mariniphaga sp.]